MVSRDKRIPLQISPAGCIWGALMLLVLPLNWLIAALFAAVFHELCHFAAIKLCDESVRGVRIGQAGAVITSSAMSPGKEWICAIAGPLGGIALLMIARWFPRVAVCALIQSAYNLLPLYPMDGGRALNCAIRLFFPEKRAGKICLVLQNVVQLVLTAAVLWLVIRFSLGILPILLLTVILLRSKKAKSS